MTSPCRLPVEHHEMRQEEAEEFVVAWQLAKSPREVADRLKMPTHFVEFRQWELRELGVHLKEMSFVNCN